MSNLVVTNIRVSKAELQRYRQLANAAGMSLSQFIRAVVGQYTHQKLVRGQADVRRIDVQQPREAEPIWQLRPLHKNGHEPTGHPEA